MSYAVSPGVNGVAPVAFSCQVVRSAEGRSLLIRSASVVRLSSLTLFQPVAGIRLIRTAEGRSLLIRSASVVRLSSLTLFQPVAGIRLIRTAEGRIVGGLSSRVTIKYRTEYRVYSLSAYGAILLRRSAVGIPLSGGGAEPAPSTGQLWPVAG
jgi:hypothetical protein